jgi:hypothetical protein
MAPLLECHEASKHHLLKFGFFLLDSINLGFLLRERLATVLIIPPSWGSQLGSYPARIKLFFWRRCRGQKKKNKFPRQLGTTSKNMMDRRNPNHGYPTISKPSKYLGAPKQQRCKACSYTSSAQPGLG